MMRKGEIGQAFIWVLILLTVGSLTLVPGLGFAFTSLKNTQIADRNVRSLYLAEAAQEYVLWQLSYGDLGNQLVSGGDTAVVPVDICGGSAEVLVVLRAVETQGAVVFATEHVIKPTLTVSPATVENDTDNAHTYTLNLEQLSPDTSQGLDAIYHLLPRGFDEDDYVEGSSQIRYGNGPWETIDDPDGQSLGGMVRLQWPATYVWDDDTETGTDGFISPFSDFQVREIKELKFTMDGRLGKNETHPSWVVLKPWDTLTGAAGLIIVGSPADPDVMEGGMIQSEATTNPPAINPGEYTEIEYTIHMTNYDKETLGMEEIRMWLPPEFEYFPGTTTGVTTDDPLIDILNLNGLDRWFLNWTDDELPPVSIASGATETLTFMTWADINDSGTYFAELMVFPSKPVPTLLDRIGVSAEEYVANYSWNTGGIVVPHYDSQATAGEVVIDTNFGWISGQLNVLSWHLE
ncbi:hypothetical protein ACFLV4_07700 [Chloroflexota bacterium]